MSTPGYPNICYSFGGSNQPVSDSLRVRIAANGRTFVQSLSDYDACDRELEHFAIESTEKDELLAFWDANRAQAFIWTDETGLVWSARFRSRPVVTHIAGTRYTVVSRLLLSRIDQ